MVPRVDTQEVVCLFGVRHRMTRYGAILSYILRTYGVILIGAYFPQVQVVIDKHGPTPTRISTYVVVLTPQSQ